MPVGVSVNVDQKGSNKLLANLDKLGDQVSVSSGGIGGGPGNGWLGQRGQAIYVRLNLRVSSSMILRNKLDTY